LEYSKSGLVYSSGKVMQFDVCIPAHSIAFEYNGQQHYEWTILQGSPKEQQRRDQEKREVHLTA
jgi:hypothetical protein